MKPQQRLPSQLSGQVGTFDAGSLGAPSSGEARDIDASGSDPVWRARDRLARAVALLEEAAVGLEARCRQQQQELDAARAEAEALRESQDALAERLDAAIVRLRSIVGE